MGDPEVEELGIHLPDAREQGIVDLVGVERDQWARVAGIDHQDRIPAVGHIGGDDRHDGNPRTLSEQGHEGLVLDLMQATTELGRLPTVPQRGPDRGDELAVPCVAAVDLHEQRSVVSP